MAFIHSELDDIMNAGNLPKASDLAESERGRITIGAACAFQARAYLYESNYAKVKEYAGRLINDQATYGEYRLFEYAAKKKKAI
ncbi:hypothetical protein [Niabella ginsengisoli]|uniref:Uncharacterized protein n=1 Tax=Niabella ginsengisoli TaxID=522298 RepID=A0ABS9SKN7_9BACT|nr:hypothetical protein [Niabella ginsengisoli]MCH5598936.1 hypothetical protein [Niabella ginsengisoli]